MKRILIAGAGLMVAASIYGFIDYNKANEKKEFKNMYRTDASANADVKEVNEKVDRVAESKSISVNPINEKLKEEDVKMKTEADIVKKKLANNNSTSAKKDTKAEKRKVPKEMNLKMFSRAPIRDIDLEEKPIVNHNEKTDTKKQDKTEPKITEKKEQ